MTQNTHSFTNNGSFVVDVLLTPEWQEASPSVEVRVKECVAEVFYTICPDLVKTYEVEVVVNLSDEKTVHGLNAEYRGKDKPTNVLSFANYEGPNWWQTANLPSDMPLLIGDMVLAYGVVAREASEQGKKFEAHLSHLVVHGCLHLLGYDHLNDADAEVMEGLEKKILFGLGIENPYHNDEIKA
ncbi:MAG: rRNA maturation RNase YbeY [Sphingomonadales bacterium]|nr:rRNA maturation RNase YbeY [Sphingomonadales bacterium]